MTENAQEPVDSSEGRINRLSKAASTIRQIKSELRRISAKQPFVASEHRRTFDRWKPGAERRIDTLFGSEEARRFRDIGNMHGSSSAAYDFREDCKNHQAYVDDLEKHANAELASLKTSERRTPPRSPSTPTPLKSGQQYELALLSVDFAGSTALKEKLGEEGARLILDDWQRHMDGIRRTFGAHDMGWEGDGGRIAFEGDGRIERAFMAGVHVLFYPVTWMMRSVADRGLIRVRAALHSGVITWCEKTGDIKSADIDAVEKVQKGHTSTNTVCATWTFLKKSPEHIKAVFTRVAYALGEDLYSTSLAHVSPPTVADTPPHPLACPASDVDSHSKYHVQQVPDIVKTEVAAHGIDIGQVQISDRLHIGDLERMCARIYSPRIPPARIHDILHAARAKAFGLKYAEPREDEKLYDLVTLNIGGLRPWNTYFIDVLRDRGVVDPNKTDILYVGIGNGHADAAFLNTIHSFKAVDISSDALAYARQMYPQMHAIEGSAEDLRGAQNASVDLYLSLRVYQSTLFDRRSAVHEAYRVLKLGGLAVTSVPTMYPPRRDGSVPLGLMPPGSQVASMEYAHEVAGRILGYFKGLNFRNVGIDIRSPFELFIVAQR